MIPILKYILYNFDLTEFITKTYCNMQSILRHLKLLFKTTVYCLSLV